MFSAQRADVSRSLANQNKNICLKCQWPQKSFDSILYSIQGFHSSRRLCSTLCSLKPNNFIYNGYVNAKELQLFTLRKHRKVAMVATPQK